MPRIDDEGFRIGLETHFESILNKYSPVLWKAYKYRLLEFEKNRDEFEGFEIQEGQGFYRVKFRDGVEKLLHLFRFADISPVTEARFLKTFTGRVLKKEVAYIPAYSFAVDAPVTLIYWGKEQSVLDPEFWRKSQMTSLLVEVPSHSMEYSLANMMWPRFVKRFYPIESLHLTRNLAQAYLFNALTPPCFDDSGAFRLFNAPLFVLTRDNSINLVSIHKTIFTVLPTQSKGDLWKVSLLTNSLKTKTIDCKVYSQQASEEPGSLHDGLFVASVEIGENGVTGPRYYIYPINHPALGVGYGVTLTLLSIILRSLYLRSRHPLVIDIRLEDLAKMSLSVLSTLARRGTSELAAHIMRDERGVAILVRALEIYQQDDGRIIYLHPYLIEMLAQIYGGIDKVPLEITPNKIVTKVLECLEAFERNDVGAFRWDIADWMRTTLRVSRPWSATNDFITSVACLERASRLTKLIYSGEAS